MTHFQENYHFLKIHQDLLTIISDKEDCFRLQGAHSHSQKMREVYDSCSTHCPSTSKILSFSLLVYLSIRHLLETEIISTDEEVTLHQ